jgi:hypothetical protein
MDADKRVRRIARRVVGVVKSVRVETPKPLRKARHKGKDEELD